ncbi:hypothetical protein Ddye_027268 [Dipteronia dyeriana]|uniref:HAT C-terminal dimerisation domain-containing protein n=1 Tax=Dipteronia dyeriana TaxID=168575 RepID=A0AAD9TPL5_9ROSI|nr:hypothetical protein Ddye_027268 [Dipteronia dyeriana]
MSELLNSYREDKHLGAAVVVMETKLKKYWANIPLLYALSAIIDPRVKLSGLEVLLEFIGINLSIDYSEQITDIRTKLFEIFHIYETRFGNIDIPQSTRPKTEPKQTSWSLLKRRKKDKSASTSSGQRSSPSSCTELIRYLEAQFDVVVDKEEFDLLLWWKTYTYRYPVLSHLARDVLVIPVSTVSSEQAFSTSGRIIEPRRNCLSPEMVEVLTCLRDWEHAKKKINLNSVRNFRPVSRVPDISDYVHHHKHLKLRLKVVSGILFPQEEFNEENSIKFLKQGLVLRFKIMKRNN